MALKWSKERPKEVGKYWVKYGKEYDNRIFIFEAKLTINGIEMDCGEPEYFAGPIPLPDPPADNAVSDKKGDLLALLETFDRNATTFQLSRTKEVASELAGFHVRKVVTEMIQAIRDLMGAE